MSGLREFGVPPLEKHSAQGLCQIAPITELRGLKTSQRCWRCCECPVWGTRPPVAHHFTTSASLSAPDTQIGIRLLPCEQCSSRQQHPWLRLRPTGNYFVQHWAKCRSVPLAPPHPSSALSLREPASPASVDTQSSRAGYLTHLVARLAGIAFRKFFLMPSCFLPTFHRHCPRCLSIRISWILLVVLSNKIARVVDFSKVARRVISRARRRERPPEMA
jgi:hypothetical protein